MRVVVAGALARGEAAPETKAIPGEGRGSRATRGCPRATVKLRRDMK